MTSPTEEEIVARAAWEHHAELLTPEVVRTIISALDSHRAKNAVEVENGLDNLANHLFSLDSGSGEGKLLVQAANLITSLRSIIGAVPVEQWRKTTDEAVLLYVVHNQAQYEPDPKKRQSLWEGWFPGCWTDFNGGGWTWRGMCGVVTHVARLPILPQPKE